MRFQRTRTFAALGTLALALGAQIEAAWAVMGEIGDQQGPMDVPEPAALSLIGAGLAAGIVAGRLHRRRKARRADASRRS